MVIDIKEVFWTAGFLEGEGSFHKTRTTSCVSAVQVNPEPVRKLHDLFGGRIDHIKPGPGNGHRQAFYRWSLYACRAVGLMMTIFPLLSLKRQNKIRKLIQIWKSAPGVGGYNKAKTHCPKGHPYSPENTYVNPYGKNRNCRICQRKSSRKYMAKKRGTLLTPN